jgi:hypothetical protein
VASHPGALLRNTAATLMCLSGTLQIAALWLRELTGLAVADSLCGTVYLVIGIGLFGQSRFSLSMAMLVPAIATSTLLYFVSQPTQIYTLRMAVDVVVVLLCTIVLWETRHLPSA